MHANVQQNVEQFPKDVFDLIEFSLSLQCPESPETSRKKLQSLYARSHAPSGEEMKYEPQKQLRGERGRGQRHGSHGQQRYNNEPSTRQQYRYAQEIASSGFNGPHGPIPEHEHAQPPVSHRPKYRKNMFSQKKKHKVANKNSRKNSRRKDQKGNNVHNWREVTFRPSYAGEPGEDYKLMRYNEMTPRKKEKQKDFRQHNGERENMRSPSKQRLIEKTHDTVVAYYSGILLDTDNLGANSMRLYARNITSLSGLCQLLRNMELNIGAFRGIRVGYAVRTGTWKKGLNLLILFETVEQAFEAIKMAMSNGFRAQTVIPKRLRDRYGISSDGTYTLQPAHKVPVSHLQMDSIKMSEEKVEGFGRHLIEKKSENETKRPSEEQQLWTPTHGSSYQKVAYATHGNINSNLGFEEITGEDTKPKQFGKTSFMRKPEAMQHFNEKGSKDFGMWNESYNEAVSNWSDACEPTVDTTKYNVSNRLPTSQANSKLVEQFTQKSMENKLYGADKTNNGFVEFQPQRVTGMTPHGQNLLFNQMNQPTAAVPIASYI